MHLDYPLIPKIQICHLNYEHRAYLEADSQ